MNGPVTQTVAIFWPGQLARCFFQLSEKEWGVNPLGTLPAMKSNVFLNDSVLNDVSQESDSNTCLPMMSSVYHQSKPPPSERPRSSNFKKGGKGSPWPWIGTCPHLFENALICITIPCSRRYKPEGRRWRAGLYLQGQECVRVALHSVFPVLLLSQLNIWYHFISLSCMIWP